MRERLITRVLRVESLMLMLLSLAMILVVFVAGFKATHASVYPWQLRRGSEYLLFAPGLCRYCLVPIGTPASEIVRRLGKPSFVAEPDDPYWARYIRARAHAGWSVPARGVQSRVFVYEVVKGYDMIIVYYFFDDRGCLNRTFIGET